MLKQASQQSAKKQKRYTNFSDTNRAEIGRYTAIIYTTRVVVKIEGGAKIGILLICKDKTAKLAKKWPNRKGFLHAKCNSITVVLR